MHIMMCSEILSNEDGVCTPQHVRNHYFFPAQTTRRNRNHLTRMFVSWVPCVLGPGLPYATSGEFIDGTYNSVGAADVEPGAPYKSAFEVIMVAREIMSNAMVTATCLDARMMTGDISTTLEDDVYEEDEENVFLIRAMMITMSIGLITIIVKIQSFAMFAARKCRRRMASPFDHCMPTVRNALVAGRAAHNGDIDLFVASVCAAL